MQANDLVERLVGALAALLAECEDCDELILAEAARALELAECAGYRPRHVPRPVAAFSAVGGEDS